MRHLIVLLALPLVIGADKCSISWPVPVPSPTPTAEPSPTPSPEPTPVPTPTPTVPPPPSPTPPIAAVCPYELPKVRMVGKPHGQGFDGNPVVIYDCQFCASIGLGSFPDGTPRCSCPVAPEGKPYRKACEIKAMSGCPKHEGKCYSDTPLPGECPITFDHFDRDDPQTPEYEGENPECGATSGFWAVAHGKGTVRICAPDSEIPCSAPMPVDH